MLISPHYHLRDWRRLDLSDPTAKDEDWKTAADIVEDRVRGRLIRWIDKLVTERFAGFAVIALDCTLIESLVGFETGKASRGKEDVYLQFLRRSRFRAGGFDNDAAGLFCKCIRNGITHDAETRRGWLIEMSVPAGAIVEKTQTGEYRLNRTAFHSGIVGEFEAWLQSVRSGTKSARVNMRRRMEHIIDKHFEK